MQTVHLRAQAVARIVHKRRTKYSPRAGLWLYETLSDEEVHNLITDGGRVALHTYIYGLAADRVAASLGADGLSYIGLTNDGTAPAAGDTTLTGELSGDGLSRTQGTVLLPTGAGVITTISNQFTFVGASQQVQKTALFDAGAGGNMAHELLFTQRTLVTSDTITITFSITLT